MRPIAQWPLQARHLVRGVLTDIDDTLTANGALTSEARHALETLQQGRIGVIAVTGRPSGWSAPFALAWPVAAIVAENGAILLRRAADGSLLKEYAQDAATRARNFERMHVALAHIEAEVPGAHRARDSGGRECDIAIDHSEFTQLPQSAVARCVALMRAAGMHASVSSIHINGWYGEHNKWEGARWAVRALLGADLTAELDRWVYVGDSTNDELMFQHFANSVGVANIARFADKLRYPPRYVTRAERGAGFAEMTRCLLS